MSEELETIKKREEEAVTLYNRVAEEIVSRNEDRKEIVDAWNSIRPQFEDAFRSTFE
jgi:glycerol-3-phosphate dehydrogenase